jgi:hypothetical protein
VGQERRAAMRFCASAVGSRHSGGLYGKGLGGSGAEKEPYRSPEFDATFADAGRGPEVRLGFSGTEVGGFGKLE